MWRGHFVFQRQLSRTLYWSLVYFSLDQTFARAYPHPYFHPPNANQVTGLRHGSRISVGRGPWAQNLLKIGFFPLKLLEHCMILKKSCHHAPYVHGDGSSEVPSPFWPNLSFYMSTWKKASRPHPCPVCETGPPCKIRAWRLDVCAPGRDTRGLHEPSCLKHRTVRM